MKHERRNQQDALAPEQRDLTRRELLEVLTAGAITATVALSVDSVASAQIQTAPVSPVPSTGEGKIQRAIAFNVESFPLQNVRLLEGPFLQAQQRDEKYLLQLEPDRMLHNFRVNAGLEPKAPVYGGWESVQPWVNIRAHGHTLGHYLTACSLMYASTGKTPFKQRVAYIVGELQECQGAGKHGLICAFPDKETQIDNLVAGRAAVGVPWYTLHKILAGLRDACLYCNDPTALIVLARACDWAIEKTRDMTDAQFERMLRIEHGGMNEVLADAYVLTGQSKYLTLSERFCHRAVLEPLAQSRDTLDGLHSNTQIPKFIGFSRLYGLTGRPDYLAASQFFWQTVVSNRSWVTGGNADAEHFFPPADFAKHLGSAKTMETCCSHNMLKLSRMLFMLDPSATYADYFERTLYNSILASQDPDSGMMTYFQSTRPGYLKLYCTPVDSFWCCTGTGIENHAKYGDSIYFRGRNALYVNLFIPSTVTWTEKGLTVTQTTRFPEVGKTTLKLTVDRPVALILNIRHPAWCEGAAVKVNGSPVPGRGRSGSYISINRVWKSGDIIDVTLPMKLQTVALPGSPDIVAFVYGPIVLAGMLGRQRMNPGADQVVNERTIGDVLNEPVEVPVLVGDPARLADQIKPSATAPLTFTTSGIGRSGGVTMIPYYRVAHERYTLYWKVTAV